MDYLSIAEMLRQHVHGAIHDVEETVATAIANNLAGFFEEADPKFDVVAFLDLIGVRNDA